MPANDWTASLSWSKLTRRQALGYKFRDGAGEARDGVALLALVGDVLPEFDVRSAHDVSMLDRCRRRALNWQACLRALGLAVRVANDLEAGGPVYLAVRGIAADTNLVRRVPVAQIVTLLLGVRKLDGGRRGANLG